MASSGARPEGSTGPSAPAATGGTLYVVATPIGNLSDASSRAIDVLRGVPLVACEDTRVTRRLLVRYDIDARLTSFHARSGPARLTALLEHLRGGADLALTTDAGTPGISDPGENLVRAWSVEGGRVVPIPGPSAVLAAVMATGIVGPRWSFEGFLPRSGRERRERIARLAGDDRGSVLYEAPTRLVATLRDLAAACGDERSAAVCRELTKVHEQIEHGSLVELAAGVEAGRIPARGEIVIVVGAAAARDDGPTGGSEDAIEAARGAVEELVVSGVPRGEAARRVAAMRGVPRRSIYGR